MREKKRGRCCCRCERMEEMGARATVWEKRKWLIWREKQNEKYGGEKEKYKNINKYEIVSIIASLSNRNSIKNNKLKKKWK